MRTEQQYNFYRTYDPSTGRYLEADPLGLSAGLDSYLYALGDPVRFVDDDGRDVREWFEGTWRVGPFYAFKAGGTFLGLTISDQAERAARATNLPEPYQNAFQHCLFQCLLARAYGQSPAVDIGEIHERAGARRRPTPQPEADRRMDEANNAAGRQCALDRNRSCEENCMAQLRRGGLFGPGGSNLPPLPLQELPNPVPPHPQ